MRKGLAYRLLLPTLVVLICLAVSIVLYYLVVEQSSEHAGQVKIHRSLGVGSTSPKTIYQAWLKAFKPRYMAYMDETDVTLFNFTFAANGSRQGQLDMMHQSNIHYAATDMTLLDDFIEYILPSSSSVSNIDSKYVYNSTREHVGIVVFPVLASALTLIHSLPIDHLNLTAYLVGEMFAGKISSWSHPDIIALNPQAASLLLAQTQPFYFVVPFDLNGLNQVFVDYFGKYSSSVSGMISSIEQGTSRPELVFMQNAAAVPYIVSSFPGSIGVVDETYMRTSFAIDNVRVARIQNQAGHFVAPNQQSIQAAMKDAHLATGIKADVSHKYNVKSLLDSKQPDAYPISTLTYIMMREHYYYQQAPPVTAWDTCQDIQMTVWLWSEAIVNMDNVYEVVEEEMGYTPLDKVLQKQSIETLNQITCGGRFVLNDIELYKQSLEFYSDVAAFRWSQSVLFWKNLPRAFTFAKLGSCLYVVFYFIVIVWSAEQFIVKCVSLWKHSDSRDIQKLQSSAAKGEKRVRLSSQNMLALLSICLTFLQYTSLLFFKTMLPISSRVAGKVAAYIGLVVPDLYYLAVIIFLVGLWLVGIYYLLVIRPFIVQAYSAKVSVVDVLFQGGTLKRKRTSPLQSPYMIAWDHFLVLFLPNFATMGFTPAVDLMMKAFDCREWNEVVFMSSFSFGTQMVSCYSGSHWYFMLFSFLLAPLFVGGVFTYTKIFKAYRKQFDFLDKGIFVVSEPALKFSIVVLYFNVTAKAFFGTCACLTFLTSVYLILCRPNVFRFFDHLRALLYGTVSLLSLFFLVVEFQVKEEHYSLRNQLARDVSVGILVFELLVVVMILLIVYKKIEKKNSSEAEKQRKDVEALFMAISSGKAQSRRGSTCMTSSAFPTLHRASRKPTTRARANSLAPIIEKPHLPLDIPEVTRIMLPDPAPFLLKHELKEQEQESDESDDEEEFPWNQVKQVVELAKNQELVPHKVAQRILSEIEHQGELIPCIFERSGRNFDEFVKSIQLRVWELMGSDMVEDVGEYRIDE